MKFYQLLTVIICISLNVALGAKQYERVLLDDVKTLTLYKGERTQARRVSSIPQLKCIGGSAKCAYEPEVVQCYNRGSNGVDIQWECTSEMPTKYKFGKISVSCEGYSNPDDPYILAGSCGLEYKLELADRNSYDSYQSKTTGSGSRFWSFLFKVALITVVFLVVKSYLGGGNQTGGTRPMGTGSDRRPPGGGGGGWFSNLFPGGSGGFGRYNGGSTNQNNANRGQPPPPPGFRSDYTNYDDTGADCTANRQQNAGGSNGSSFLTGAALGALGGYVFGTRNRRPDYQYMPGTANTGWFGTGSTTNTNQYSSSSSSGSTHTSSGYGGTTRR